MVPSDVFFSESAKNEAEKLMGKTLGLGENISISRSGACDKKNSQNFLSFLTYKEIYQNSKNVVWIGIKCLDIST